MDLKYVKNVLTMGLSLDQKLSKGDEGATLYDFDKGISPGTTLGANLQYIIWNNKKDSSYSNAFLKVKSELKASHPEIKTTGMILDTVLKYANEKERKILLESRDHNPIFLNLKVAFTKTKFSYTSDSLNLTKQEENKVTPEVSLALAFPTSVKSYFAIVYTYSESFEAGSTTNFIRQFGTTKNSFTQSLAFGAPSHSVDHKLTGEFRQNFEKIPNLAIAPSITYGLESEKLAFTLPVYFIKGITSADKPNGIQGGVNFGYVTQTKDKWSKFKDGFGAQLIVTAPLSLFDIF
jgi:hypothetical protein